MLLPPLSLYVHIPWCVRKCPYCDFNSHTAPDFLPEEAYLEALKVDLGWQLASVQGRKLVSIFMGGGTPSLLSGEFYRRLLSYIKDHIAWADDIEITLEANPGTVEHQNFQDYRQAGINRLSLGVQSFQENQLKALGRIHGRAEAVTAITSAKQAGFERINLDLMHGLPQQTLYQALADLQLAIGLGVEQISWYQLTLEPNTVFYRDRPVLPDENTLDAIDEQGKWVLSEADYQQYEVSAFTRGEPCRHNMNYWEFGDYLAIGAGAHAKITSPEGIVRRYQQTRMPEDYMKAMAKAQFPLAIEVDPALLPQEFFMNALRLKAGVPFHYYEERTGLKTYDLQARLSALEPGLLAPTKERWVCTEQGYNFLNRLLQQLA